MSNSLKWTENTDLITSKARSRIWTLRRLKKLGFDHKFILEVYIKEIRSILEYCVPLWNGSLTKKESEKIEKIQKSVLKLLLKNHYISYSEACEQFNLEKLYIRRQKLCVQFSNKEYKKPDNGIFEKFQPKSKRLAHTKVVLEPKTRTERHYKSAIPYLSRLLNKQCNKKQK